MKPASTITATIFLCLLAAGLASAQNPRVIQNTRNTMNAVSKPATAAPNQAAANAPARPSRPAVVTPKKPSAALPSAERKKHRGEQRGVWAAGVIGGSPAAPANDNLSVATAAASQGAPESMAGENAQNEQPVVPDGKHVANGRRDPFISPVMKQLGASGCSTGKKCLDIGTISLRGVVRAEGGYIAVVSNSMNKAYFLRENDPVFNGYVVKITDDSIVFQETAQDRLGKSFTREVVKKITAPVA